MHIISHRGAKGLATENTKKSFQAALLSKASEIETDARVTSDGIVILAHDPEIISPDGSKYMIMDHTFGELLNIAPDTVTLQDTIMLINRAKPLIIEVKPKEPIGPVVYVVKKFLDEGWSNDDFLFASFSQKTLEQLHSAFPGITKVVNQSWLSVMARHRAKRLDTKRITMSHRAVWFGFVWAMHRQGFKLSVYTLNRPLKTRLWRKLGLYGVVTDYPDRFSED